MEEESIAASIFPSSLPRSSTLSLRRARGGFLVMQPVCRPRTARRRSHGNNRGAASRGADCKGEQETVSSECELYLLFFL